MTDKLIEAIKNVQIAHARGLVHPVETTIEGKIFFEHARSTLTPPDTQGALDALEKLGNSAYGSERCMTAATVMGLSDIIYTALTRPSREAKLLKALENIAVYDMYYCSSTEETDFEAQAKSMYETARDAISEYKKGQQNDH